MSLRTTHWAPVLFLFASLVADDGGRAAVSTLLFFGQHSVQQTPSASEHALIRTWSFFPLVTHMLRVTFSICYSQSWPALTKYF